MNSYQRSLITHKQPFLLYTLYTCEVAYIWESLAFCSGYNDFTSRGQYATLLDCYVKAADSPRPIQVLFLTAKFNFLSNYISCYSFSYHSLIYPIVIVSRCTQLLAQKEGSIHLWLTINFTIFAVCTQQTEFTWDNDKAMGNWLYRSLIFFFIFN